MWEKSDGDQPYLDLGARGREHNYSLNEETQSPRLQVHRTAFVENTVVTEIYVKPSFSYISFGPTRAPYS